MYEDYMKNLLGGNYSPYQNTYEQMARNTGCCDKIDDYEQCCYDWDYDQCYSYMDMQNAQFGQMPYNYMQNISYRNMVSDLENLYPEIYKIIYPMIQKVCGQNTKPVDEKLLDEMTNDIYSNIEAENIVNININVDNNTSQNNRNVELTRTSNTNKKLDTPVENRESRQFNNPIRDLIRILLIRELIGRPGGNRPPRPRPPMPPRPPFPPRPGFPGNPPPRPPFPPRPGFPGNPPPRPRG